MANSVSDGLRDRMAALWDSTPTASLVGTIFSVAAVVIIGTLVLGRLSDSNSSDQGGPDVAAVERTTSTEAEDEQIPVTELDPFFVVGNQIIDPQQQLFVPVGVNAAIRTTNYAYVYDGGNGGINGRVESVKAWGWNTVRATLVCHDESGAPAQQDVIHGIDETVRELTEERIVVILACHDGTGSDLQLEDEIDLEVRAFWDQVVPRYSNNPYVWFNFFNEPYTTFDPDQWIELHEFYYDRYRSQGVENIMVFDLPRFAQGIDHLAEDSFADDLGNKCNTVFGWHAWGSLSGKQATDDDYQELSQMVLDRNLAVTITEAGVPEPLNAGTAGNPEWNEGGYYAALKVAERSPIGLLWWHGTGDTSNDLFYPLKTDKTGFWTANDAGALTLAGATFWEYSHQERAVEQFTGDLTDSTCPSSFDVESDE